jgi:flagellar biosynthesis/type III secretory pathway M-ring protein FliF/YscJ
VDVIAPLLVILALGVVVLIVSAPLRANRARRAADPDEARRADLEAAKEDKYREIRDAEMDFRTGKLSEADWRALDRELRAEAVELLRRVDELGPPG